MELSKVKYFRGQASQLYLLLLKTSFFPTEHLLNLISKLTEEFL